MIDNGNLPARLKGHYILLFHPGPYSITNLNTGHTSSGIMTTEVTMPACFETETDVQGTGAWMKVADI